MYELIQVSEHDYYIRCPAKIGVIRLNDTEACLIDSGNDREAGKKALKILAGNGWTLKAIYNTHSHADHIGGNRYLQEQTGCAVYCPAMECGFVNHTVLEPSFLYGGYPCGDLRHKFLLAKESRALPLTADVLPEGFELIPLPGHCFDMAGLRTPDDTVFLGDCLSGKETLEKYRIGFLYDVKAYLETLEAVKGLSARMFVPSHADAAEDISDLAQYNIDTVLDIAETILRICREPVSFERLLARLFDSYRLTMTFEQYVLVGSTVRSYLSWLRDSGRVTVTFEDSTMLWTAC